MYKLMYFDYRVYLVMLQVFQMLSSGNSFLKSAFGGTLEKNFPLLSLSYYNNCLYHHQVVVFGFGALTYQKIA